MSDYRVRAVHCDHRAGDEEVYAALKRATDPLEKSWATLRQARSIAIKFNQDWLNPPMFEGVRQALVGDGVARATLRLLRDAMRSSAELFAVDISGDNSLRGGFPASTNLLPLFREFGVQFVECNDQPLKMYDVPGGGQMFQRYLLPQRAVEADAFVSVQKMKNHGFMGVTLCMKNLFGLMPREPLGHARQYYHHLVRMPYMLADLGRVFHPTLNIVDALTGQAGQEWDGGEGRITNTLIAGDHVVATDACGTHLMGHDPQADWLTPPYHRDRNALLVAAEGGFGTVDLNEIDFQSEVQAPLAEFHANITDPRDKVISWRRTTAEQAMRYLDHQREIVDRHAGEYILLQMGDVKWHSKGSTLDASRRVLSGLHPEQAMWLKYVDPDEQEGERYGVYDQALKHIPPAG